MPDFEARCRLLERENDDLRDRVAALEDMLGVSFQSPAWLGLSRSEATIFGLLLAREAVTKALVMDAIYGDRPDADAAEEKIVDVWVCKLRAKIERFGIEIETNWGQGYFMTQAMKKKMRGLIEDHQGQAA